MQDVAGLCPQRPRAFRLSRYLSRVVLLRVACDCAEVLETPCGGEAGDVGWLQAAAQGRAALLAIVRRRRCGGRVAAPTEAHATWDEVRAKNHAVQEHLRVLQAGTRRHALYTITASSERLGTVIAGRVAWIPGIEKLGTEASPPKRPIDETAGALK